MPRRLSSTQPADVGVQDRHRGPTRVLHGLLHQDRHLPTSCRVCHDLSLGSCIEIRGSEISGTSFGPMKVSRHTASAAARRVLTAESCISLTSPSTHCYADNTTKQLVLKPCHQGRHVGHCRLPVRHAAECFANHLVAPDLKRRFLQSCVAVSRLLLELGPFLTKFFGERGCLFTSLPNVRTSSADNPLADFSRGAPGAPSRASATAVDANTAGSLSCAFPLDAERPDTKAITSRAYAYTHTQVIPVCVCVCLWIYIYIYIYTSLHNAKRKIKCALHIIMHILHICRYTETRNDSCTSSVFGHVHTTVHVA